MWQHAHSHYVRQSLAYEQPKYRSWPTKLWACDSISLTSAPCCRRVPTEANMLHYKEICSLALSGQDAIKQTCCLSPVLSLVWLYLTTVKSQLWIFPDFRILPQTWPKFCKNGSWVPLSYLLQEKKIIYNLICLFISALNIKLLKTFWPRLQIKLTESSQV